MQVQFGKNSLVNKNYYNIQNKKLMAEDLEMGTEQLAEMTANAEANLAQELPADAGLELDVNAALEMGAAEQQAQNETPASFDINNMVPGGPGDGDKNFGQPSAPTRPNVSSKPTPDPSDFLKSMNNITKKKKKKTYLKGLINIIILAINYLFN